MSYIDKFISDLELTYTREIELQPKKHVGFFSVLTFTIFIIFGISGFRPSILALAQKNKFKEELQDIKLALDNKITDLSLAEKDLKEAETYLPILDKVIPSEPKTDEYLKDLVRIAARNGFIVRNFQPLGQTPEEVEVNIEFSGEVFKLDKLIKEMEDMDRLITVKEVKVNNDNVRSNVKMKIEIYYVKNLSDNRTPRL
ncbi:MAG: type 4a pilus biogenesis protein PilO [Patescibacteria group bacterium]